MLLELIHSAIQQYLLPTFYMADAWKGAGDTVEENLCLPGVQVVLRKHRPQEDKYNVLGHGRGFRIK